MKIEILGVEGCPNCTALVQETINILAQMQVPAGVEKVTDKAVIESYGPGAIPGFVINGRLKAGGRLPSRAEIIRWIREELKQK
jgi:hypothetical protein